MTESAALLGYSSLFQVEDPDDAGNYISLDEVYNITPPGFSVEKIDITHMESADRRREFVDGWVDPGECSLEMNYIPASASDILLTGIANTPVGSSRTRNCRIIFSNDISVQFSANLMTYEQSIANDDRMTATATWRINGALTYSYTPVDPTQYLIRARFNGAGSASGITLLNEETFDYIAAIEGVGGTLDLPTAYAVDSFVSSGKSAGWWDKIIDGSMCVGSNLAAALVKIVVAPTTSTSYSNNGPFVGGDYTQAGGIGDLSNTSKYLGTGVIPSAQSMDIEDMAIAIETIEDGYTGTLQHDAMVDPLLSDNPVAGDPQIFINSSRLGSTESHHSVNHGVNGSTAHLVTHSSNCILRLDGVLVLSFNGVGSTTLPTTEITILRGKVGGTFLFGKSKVGAAFIFNEGLSSSEQESFSLALIGFSRSVRTQEFTERNFWLGDSISMGVQVTEAQSWAAIVSTALEVERINSGISAAALRTPIGYFAPAITDGLGKYQDGPNLGITRLFLALGTNDAQFIGVTPPGTFQTDLEDICSFYINLGIEVVLLPPTWTGPANVDVELYRDATQAAAAAVPGVTFVDVYQAFIDAPGDPQDYFIEAHPNGFHPNVAGHALIASTVLAAL